MEGRKDPKLPKGEYETSSEEEEAGMMPSTNRHHRRRRHRNDVGAGIPAGPHQESFRHFVDPTFSEEHRRTQAAIYVEEHKVDTATLIDMLLGNSEHNRRVARELREAEHKALTDLLALSTEYKIALQEKDLAIL